MKLKIVLFFGVIFVGSMQATIITNKTPNEIELKITYAEKCFVPGYDNKNPKYYAELKVMLPASSKMDISGSLQNRQSPGCYKDLDSINATIIFNDDNDTKLSRTWSSDQIGQRQNLTIFYNSQKLLYIQ